MEQKLISLPQITPEKIEQLQKNDTFCNNILQQMHCNMNKNYFTDAMGILHKKVIDFNTTFSSVVIPRILIKYLLHASYDSLGHVGATKIIPFPQKALLLPRHAAGNTPIHWILSKMSNH